MTTRLSVLLAIALGLLAALVIYLQPRFGTAPALGVGPAPVGSTAPRSADYPSQALAGLGAAATDPNGAKGIVVVGTGTARVTPDVAFVTVGVRTRGQTAKEAQDANNKTMAAVLAQVKALRIAEQDIQTSGINLSPVIQRENVVSGYEATNVVTVRVQDVSQAGPVLDAAVAGGANVAGSVRFGLKDPSGATRQALDAAAKDAQGKAEAIAKALGVQIKSVESAVEEEVGGPRVAEAMNLDAASAAAPVPVQPGELSVTARLRVTYAY